MAAPTEFFLFYSSDIVNSTAIKIYQGSKKWTTFIHKISKKILETELNLWKFLGDEWILYRPILNIQEFIIAHNIFTNLVRSLFPSPLKHKMWIIPNKKSIISPIDMPFKKDDSQYNRIIDDLNTGKQKNKKSAEPIKEDWISPYLDIAFRIGKNCHIGNIVLSVEYAYILTQDKLDPGDFRFYKFKEENLKGISFPYPNLILDVIDKKDNVYTSESETQGMVIEQKAIHNYVKHFIDNTFSTRHLYKTLII